MIITQTPLRLSLAGGGSDLAEYYQDGAGQVVSTAIDKYIFVMIKERFDDKIVLNYSRNETVDHVSEVKHELIRETMLKTNIRSGVEISTLADIPSEGSGLGSSSSLVVGLLNAMYMFRGEQVTAERLADEACDIEINRCGRPIGKQDQYIAAYGGLRIITFHPDGAVETEPVGLNSSALRHFGSNLMLFYTNKTRKSSEILLEQRDHTPANRDTISAMVSLVHGIVDALRVEHFDDIGHVLHEAWTLKRRLSERISNNEIDDMYDRAREAGALGGKIAGAGGGGFMVLYVPQARQEHVRAALSDFYELPFFPERDGSKVIFNLKRYPFK